MKTLEQMMAKVARDNRAAEAKVKCNAKQAVELASFLRGWAKGKPIVRQDADATFWAAGKWMTKLAWPQVVAMREAGLVDISGDPKARGCVITMRKVG
jgi:hypothetical protein